MNIKGIRHWTFTRDRTKAAKAATKDLVDKSIERGRSQGHKEAKRSFIVNAAAYGADQVFWVTVLAGAGALSGGNKVSPTKHDLHRPRVEQSREQELRPGYSRSLTHYPRIERPKK